jgi:hypothetical protein
MPGDESAVSNDRAGNEAVGLSWILKQNLMGLAYFEPTSKSCRPLPPGTPKLRPQPPPRWGRFFGAKIMNSLDKRNADRGWGSSTDVLLRRSILAKSSGRR